MAGVRSNPRGSGKYQGWFFDAGGKRKYFTGTSGRAETRRMAKRLEDEHRQIRLGYRPAPSTADRHRNRPFAEASIEYQEWGAAQGGLKGRPWSNGHAQRRRSQLRWWREALGLETLSDLNDAQPRVERALRELQATGRSGKTLANYSESISAFCDWCVQRGYLADDPLKGMAPFDVTPQSRRRAMTPDEIRLLLHASPPDRSLLYEMALFSGLRANELRSLTTDDLDLDRCGVNLDAEWTKNRQEGFQPLYPDLVQRLHRFAGSGEPAELYKKALKRGGSKRNAPPNPLLYVPSQPARIFDKDLEAAGIVKLTPMGKLDFHASRVSYINILLDRGVGVREAQALARHSTPQMTMNVYGRTRQEKLSEVVSEMAESVLGTKKCAIYVPRLAVGAERENATPLETRELRSSNLAPLAQPSS